MKRKLENKLLEWKKHDKRKPVLLHGARQVGKTWMMKYFGESHFDQYLYINFEKEMRYRDLFKESLDPQRVLVALEILTGKKVIPGQTLLLFDEIQEAENGLTILKYFQEDLPELHIIAAGSLVGIALEKQSFPVGKVEFVKIDPLDLEEFFWATGNQRLNDLVCDGDWQTISLLKEEFLNVLRDYYFVGGMPEAVQTFIEKKNHRDVREVQTQILLAYQQDFARHAPGEVIPKIKIVWNSVVSQLAKENKKFVYGLMKKGARAKEFETALDWLEEYGLITRIYNLKKAGLPLAAYRDLKSFKLFVLDVGLLGALAKLEITTLINKNRLFQEFKGALTEQFACQELQAKHGKNIYYWTNPSGNAEVDFIFEHQSTIYPLEVKAAENLKSKSLKTFAAKYPGIHCYRTSTSNYRKEEWMTNVPLYAIGHLGLNDL
ncbi:MAG: ATP-binding protein [Saprospirales bacterium]|nr:MAG: ATP-binding protein [Saprospirales bacterium]